jgi:hypothetical protein
MEKRRTRARRSSDEPARGKPPAKRASAAGHATYLYCALHSDKRPSAAGSPRGLPGASAPRFVDAGEGIWLVASDAPLSDYAGEIIDQKLSDLTWVGERAMAHEAVVEHFARKHTTIPMKLFTLFSSEERAVADVLRRRPLLLDTMKHVAGRDEWGVRMRLDERRARAAAAEAARSGAPPPTSGTSFLLRKKKEKDVTQELAQHAREEALRAFAELSRKADDARQRPITQGDSGAPLLLDAAFLVRREKTAPFEKAVARLAAELGPRGYDVTLTGPWPVYHFLGNGK